MNIQQLKDALVLPVIAAPMFLVSGTRLLIACCKAGVVGSIPAGNARTGEQLAQWLEEIRSKLAEFEESTGRKAAPWALNVIVVDIESERFTTVMRLIEQYQPPIVITSFGQPGKIAERVHAYGGLVFHDIATLRHAKKAIEAGVDGLIVLTAGAGGHTGVANPFALVPQIRKMWDGAVLLSGSITDGPGILAAEALGADFAYMGTRFAATQESLASDEYRSLLLSQSTIDIVTTERISGVAATFMRGSITRVGLDPDHLPAIKSPRSPALPEGIKAWRDVWSAGHGVGLIEDIPTVAELTNRLKTQYDAASLRLAR